jgi:Fe-S-cluster containining protein
MTLPDLYARWMTDLLPAGIEPERRSTCDSCAMAPREDDAPRVLRYHPHLKCCTYYPELPNFVAGHILLDPEAPGRGHLEARLRGAPRVTPMYVARPPLFDTVYRQAARTTFGTIEKLRCPYLTADARCGIWRHREGVCATYFCAHNRGAVGEQFWASLRRLLSAVEKQLATWCVLQLDLGDAGLAALAAEAPATLDASDVMDRVWDDEARAQHQRRWGRWAGRERELYEAAARLTAGLTWGEVVAIGGARVALLSRMVVAAHAALTAAQVPAALRVGSHRVARTADGRLRFIAYSEADVLEVPAEVGPALARFDGRPTAVVAVETGLDDEVLVQLVDHRVLVPCA